MISIIIPVYNAEKTLRRCVDSVLAQRQQDFEILLVNDGSADGSLAICREYEKQDRRIVVLDQKNAGVSVARNCGLQHAKGEYIQFIDSDDFILPDMCSTMLQAAQNCKSDLVVCGFTSIALTGSREICYPEKIYADVNACADDFICLYQNAFFHSPCNKLYKKDKVCQAFQKDISIGEDLIFNLSYFANAHNICVLGQPFYQYVNQNVQSLSNRMYADDHLLIAMKYKLVRQALPAIAAVPENNLFLTYYELKEQLDLYIRRAGAHLLQKSFYKAFLQDMQARKEMINTAKAYRGDRVLVYLAAEKYWSAYRLLNGRGKKLFAKQWVKARLIQLKKRKKGQ